MLFTKIKTRGKREEEKKRRMTENIQKVEQTMRAHPGSNRRPIDLQSIALPLSYGPLDAGMLPRNFKFY